MTDSIRPLEKVLLQLKCYNTSLKKNGLMIVTTTRMLWRVDTTFPIQIIRAGVQLNVQRTSKGTEYWVIQIIEPGWPKPWFFRFYGVTGA
jgi:hypothetical protein